MVNLYVKLKVRRLEVNKASPKVEGLVARAGHVAPPPPPGSGPGTGATVEVRSLLALLELSTDF